MDCIHGKQNFWYGYYDEKNEEDEKRITDISAMIEKIVCRKPDMVKSGFCQKIMSDVYLTVQQVDFYRDWEEIIKINKNEERFDFSRAITESKLLYVLSPGKESSKVGWTTLNEWWRHNYYKNKFFYPDSSILAPVLKALKDNFCFEHYKETV
jgi:hypothetical protein